MHRPPLPAGAGYDYPARTRFPCLIRCLRLLCRLFEIGLNALSGVLDKAGHSLRRRKSTPRCCSTARLAPDMFALTRQVQVACDQAKNGMARIAGIEPPKFEDTETTIAQLKERIAKTVASPQDARRQGHRRPGRPRDRLPARAGQGRRCRATINSATSCCRISIFTPRRLTRSCAITASMSASAIFSARFRSRGSEPRRLAGE